MTKPKNPPRAKAPEATTLEQLGLTRVLRGRIAPSGNRYDLRPVNLERYALSGSMPSRLRSAAIAGSQGVNELLGADEEKLSDEGEKAQEWLDRLVCELIVAPILYAQNQAGEILRNEEGAKVVDGERIDLLPPIDYKWAVAIALGECDEDGDGARLWGREPLSRWAMFREEHGCNEDCEGCSRVVDAFSAAL